MKYMEDRQIVLEDMEERQIVFIPGNSKQLCLEKQFIGQRTGRASYKDTVFRRNSQNLCGRR